MARLSGPEYQSLRSLLIEAREEAGLSQAEVAERLGRVQTFVSKYELGDRRLDVIEYLKLCEVLGVDPGKMLKRVQGKG